MFSGQQSEQASKISDALSGVASDLGIKSVTAGQSACKSSDVCFSLESSHQSLSRT